MYKLVIVFSVLLGISTIANAGFLDSIFGSKKQEEPVVQAEPEQAQPESAVATATNLAMGLLPELTNQLGVTDTQAEGGMGSLLQAAKTQLTSDEYGQLSDGIPGMDALLAAAPMLASSSDKSSGGLSGALSGLGGVASSLGSLGQLTSQFEALGLSPDMIAKFAKIAIDYFSNDSAGGGTDIGALLQKGLGSFMN